MKIKILGCGASSGVPSLLTGFGACDQKNVRNFRTRSSMFLQMKEARILIDAGPDLRMQFLRSGLREIDALFLTHSHYDHVGGINELREINRLMGRAIPTYAEAKNMQTLRDMFGFAFAPFTQGIFRPALEGREIVPGEVFKVEGIPVLPYEQDHGYSRSTGYRIGDVAYSTDFLRLPHNYEEILSDLKLFVVSCQSVEGNSVHAGLQEVIAIVERLRPQQALLTHMGTGMDYESLCNILPPNIRPAYDGLEADI